MRIIEKEGEFPPPEIPEMKETLVGHFHNSNFPQKSQYLNGEGALIPCWYNNMELVNYKDTLKIQGGEITMFTLKIRLVGFMEGEGDR